MSAPETEKTVCGSCSAVLETRDRFCRHCGAPISAPAEARSHRSDAATPDLVPVRPPTGRRIADSRAMVLLLLFAVLGPLALPTLWRSSRFSRFWKIALTALVLIITAVIVWILWWAISLFLDSLKQLKEADLLLSAGPGLFSRRRGGRREAA